MEQNAVSVTEGKAKKTGFADGLQNGGDGKLGGLYFGLARDA